MAEILGSCANAIYTTFAIGVLSGAFTTILALLALDMMKKARESRKRA